MEGTAVVNKGTDTTLTCNPVEAASSYSWTKVFICSYKFFLTSELKFDDEIYNLFNNWVTVLRLVNVVKNIIAVYRKTISLFP